MVRPHIHLSWKPTSKWTSFRTGVSLHSHTSHSRETLDFIPRISSRIPIVREAVRFQERRYREANGRDLDYYQCWWTPPLSAREALHLERNQIQNSLKMQPLVSITDHDNIEAPMLLRVLSEGRDTPISVEWTVPFRHTFFHIGVHNIAPRRAQERMAALAAFTANPVEGHIEGILAGLAEDPETLIVFNHPYWDEKHFGQELHNRTVQDFVNAYKPYLHALELNGLRPWTENKITVGLSQHSGVPLISGGDRHGCEPNALLNVTNAQTFGEFVDEVRNDRRSSVVIMPQYKESFTVRILAGICDVLRENEGHTLGWTRWSDRVFYRRDNGTIESLSSVFKGDEPIIVKQFIAMMRLVESRRFKAALRLLPAQSQELTL